MMGVMRVEEKTSFDYKIEIFEFFCQPRGEGNSKKFMDVGILVCLT